MQLRGRRRVKRPGRGRRGPTPRAAPPLESARPHARCRRGRSRTRVGSGVENAGRFFVAEADLQRALERFARSVLAVLLRQAEEAACSFFGSSVTRGRSPPAPCRAAWWDLSVGAHRGHEDRAGGRTSAGHPSHTPGSRRARIVSSILGVVSACWRRSFRSQVLSGYAGQAYPATLVKQVSVRQTSAQ